MFVFKFVFSVISTLKKIYSYEIFIFYKQLRHIIAKMNKNLDKLKQFFRNSKSHNAQERVYLLKAETERDLKKESPMAMRVKMLKDLGDVVMTNRLEEVIIHFNDLKTCSNLKYSPVCCSKAVVTDERHD